MQGDSNLGSITELLQKAKDAYKEKRIEDAKKFFLEVLKHDPNNALAYKIVGLIALVSKDFSGALTYLEKACKLNSTDATVFYHYGCVLQRLGKLHDAVRQYEKALELDPDNLAALNSASTLMKYQGSISLAIKTANQAISLNPSGLDPYIVIGSCLKDHGRISEAISYYRQVLAKQPDHLIAGSNLLLCLNYSNLDSARIFQEHVLWEQHNRTTIQPQNYVQGPFDPDKKPLRVGYVSADFRSHSVSYFIWSILENHDQTKVKTICYSDVAHPDYITAHLKKNVTLWRNTYDLKDSELLQVIRDDAIDILVDLAGHAGNQRLFLFFNRLAPVQITYCGYPNTTGLSTIDYRLTDNQADPVGSESYYSEKLVHLNPCFLCYRPSQQSPPVADLPAIKNKYITFGSFNHLPKVNETVVKLWSQILKDLPQSKLMLKTRSFNDQAVRDYYTELFAQNGIESKRLILEQYVAAPEEHLHCYDRIDIALDPFPYNGTTTTCESLLMGVPVITLAGNRHSGRVGKSLLSAIGLTGMVAKDPNNYHALALYLASDINRLANLRKGLRTALLRSPICNAQTFTINLELAYRTMWQEAIKRYV